MLLISSIHNYRFRGVELDGGTYRDPMREDVVRIEPVGLQLSDGTRSTESPNREDVTVRVN